jgi:hypothetical protein
MAEKELPIGGPQPHLSQMFTAGKLHTVVYPGKPEVEVWVARPNSQQSDKAQRLARVARARRFRELTSKDSDEAMALDVQMGEMQKAQVVDTLLDRTSRKREQQAYNEVLYSEDHGSDWGSSGSKYLELLDATIQRMEEIQKYNVEMEAAETPEGIINPTEDEELTRLNAEQSAFEAEVRERLEPITEAERIEISALGIDKVRRNLRDAMVEAECDVLWFSTFRIEMVFYSIRYPDKHGKLYFENSDQLADLPESVKGQLFSAYEDVDMGAEQTKNLLTPLPS